MKKLLIILALFVLAVPAWGQQKTRLYGTLTFFDITPENAEVTLTLDGHSYFTTSTLTVPAGRVVTYTNSSGYFAIDSVFRTDSLSGFATYTITVKHPMTQASGMVFQASGLSITTADSVSLRTVLAQ